MKTGWKMLTGAGVILILVSGQVRAQPWGNGPGGGPGFAQGGGAPDGFGPGMRPYGPGPLGPGGPWGGPRAWRAPGAGPWGRGAWAPREQGQAGIPGPLARGPGLTPVQRQEIEAIIDEACAKIRATLKEVLTDEQIQQLKQMRGQMRQFGGPMPGRGPRAGLGGPRGRWWQPGADFGPALPPRGWGRPGQPFRDGQGRGPAPQFQMEPQQPGAAEQLPAGGPGPRMGRGWNRGTQPPEQMRGGADPNQPGRRPQQGPGFGMPATPRGQGRPVPPFRGGQGQGPGFQGQPEPRQQGAPEQAPAGRPGPGVERPARRGAPSLEQIFDEADANKDGTLTKEELKAFQETRRGNGPSGRQ